MRLTKRIAAHLPERWQQELKRIHCRRRIAQGAFEPSEPEYPLLPDWIRPGDWVIDVGANVGQYTLRFSELAGPEGRVIAFEPVPETFALLSANTGHFPHANVTLINAALSDRTGVAGISLSCFPTGLTDYYKARVSPVDGSARVVITLSFDSLGIEHPVGLVKIDVEGHESAVLKGMVQLLRRDRPVLIVETESDEVIADLLAIGYAQERLPGSPNVLFRPRP